MLDGPLAFTELHLTFRNPQQRTIEGRFRITLPDGAAISRFAMRLADGWQEAEVVERQAAHEAFEWFLHQQRDPALLEKSAGNEFRARIFPIGPGALKEIKLSYSQELSSKRRAYQLRLLGLPRIGALGVTAHVLKAGGGSEPGQARSKTVRFVKQQHKPTGDFELSTDSNIKGLFHEDLFVARVRPRLVHRPSAISSLILLIDTSASQHRGFKHQLALARELLKEISAKSSGGVPLLLACYDQSVEVIYEGPISGLSHEHLDKISERGAMGASDLNGALKWAAGHPGYKRMVLLTDGVVTAGKTDRGGLKRSLSALRQRIHRLDVLLPRGVRDLALMRWLVAGPLRQAGAVLGQELPPAELARRLGQGTVSRTRIKVEGARWHWPRVVRGLQPGDEFLVYARLRKSVQRHSLKIRLEGPISQAHHIPVVPAEGPLLHRAMVRAQIGALMARHHRPEIRAQIVGLSRKYRVLSDHTALLVLEREDDYQRFGLKRAALADILVIKNGQLDILNRTAWNLPEKSGGAGRAAPAAVARVRGETVESARGRAPRGQTSSRGRGALPMRKKKAPAPRVIMGVSRVGGVLGTELIRRYVHRRINQIKFCYEEGRRRRPGLQGRVTVKFAVEAGRVLQSQIQSSTLGSPQVEQCIAEVIKRWSFPKIPRSGIVVVNYPFVLNPAAGQRSSPLFHPPRSVPAVDPAVARRSAGALERILSLTDADDQQLPDLLFRLAGHYEALAIAPNGRRWLDRAIETYRRIVKSPVPVEFHRMDEVLYRLVDALLRAGRPAEAKRHGQRLLSEYPASEYIPELHISRAEYAQRRGQVRLALEHLKKIRGPLRPLMKARALYKRARCWLKLNDPPKALAELVKLIEAFRAPAGHEQGEALLRAARRDAVLAYSLTGPEGEPDRFFRRIDRAHAKEMLVALAETYHQQGKFRASIRVYHQVMAMAPRDEKLCAWQQAVLRSSVAEGADEVKPAREARRLAQVARMFQGREALPPPIVARCRDNSESWLKELATTWHREAQVTQRARTLAVAGEIYKSLLATFPKSSDAYTMTFYHAELLFRQERWRAAAESYTRVVRMKPGGKYSREAAYAEVICWKNISAGEEIPRTRDPKRAVPLSANRLAQIAAMDRYILRARNDDGVVYMMYDKALLYYDHNHHAEASKTFAELLTRAPEHHLARAAADRLLETLGAEKKFDQMERWVDRLLTKSSPSRRRAKGEMERLKVALVQRRAEQLSESGKHTACGNLYLWLTRRFPHFPRRGDLLYHGAKCYETAKSYTRARAMFDTLVRDYPGNSLARRARLELWVLTQKQHRQEAERLWARGEHRAALALAERWRREEPDNTLALITLGELHRRGGRDQAAARAFGSIIDMSPSRADLRRFAGQHLSALGKPGVSLAIDTYEKALKLRPDHATGYRLLAHALLRAGRVRRAFAVISRGLKRRFPAGRFAGIKRVLREDLGIIGRVYMRRYPADRARISARLKQFRLRAASRPSLRFVLTWETDASDVDLHIHDATGEHASPSNPSLTSGGRLYSNVRTGYGPEVFGIQGTAHAFPYRVKVRYSAQGAMGFAMGAVQILHHDGAGRLRFDSRPFVLLNGWSEVDLGLVEQKISRPRRPVPTSR